MAHTWSDTPKLKKCFKDEVHALEIFENELKANLPELQKHGLFFTFTTPEEKAAREAAKAEGRKKKEKSRKEKGEREKAKVPQGLYLINRRFQPTDYGHKQKNYEHPKNHPRQHRTPQRERPRNTRSPAAMDYPLGYQHYLHHRGRFSSGQLLFQIPRCTYRHHHLPRICPPASPPKPPAELTPS